MGSLLGVLFASLIAMVGVGSLLGIQQRGAANQRGAATAGQLKQISSAAQGYVLANAPAIESIATPSSPATITIPMLQATQFLSSGVSAVNPYGQTWVVQVLQPSAGVLQTLVLSLGGTSIPTQVAPQIAALSGAEGGFVPAAGQYGSLNSNVAQGAYGGWQVPLAGYANPGAGHLAALVQFNNGTQTNDYLYRVAVPGQPQLNTMQTTLNMGGNSLTNGNSLQAQTAALAAGNVGGQPGALQIGSSFLYGDTANTAVRQAGTMYVQHIDGSFAPIITGDNTTSGNNSTAGNNVTGGSLTTGGDVTTYGSNSTATSVTAGTQLQVGATATMGYGCSPNGAIAASTDGSGSTMDCILGLWRPMGTAATVGEYEMPNGPNASVDLGYHYFCALNDSFEDPPTVPSDLPNSTRVAPYYPVDSIGRFDWVLARGSAGGDGGTAMCIN